MSTLYRLRSRFGYWVDFFGGRDERSILWGSREDARHYRSLHDAHNAADRVSRDRCCEVQVVRDKKKTPTVYHVTGRTSDGRRFKRIETTSRIHALGINLWCGSVWEVRQNGTRKLIKSVVN